MAEFITAMEAAKKIPDGATIGVAGMGLSGWAEEIENVLLQEERIEAVKVIGVPDEHYGEEICACIVRTDYGSDFTEEDARDLVKSHLAAYKIPRYVVFFDKLPLLGNGKVDRRARQEEVRRRNNRNE